MLKINLEKEREAMKRMAMKERLKRQPERWKKGFVFKTIAKCEVGK